MTFKRRFWVLVAQVGWRLMEIADRKLSDIGPLDVKTRLRVLEGRAERDQIKALK